MAETKVQKGESVALSNDDMALNEQQLNSIQSDSQDDNCLTAGLLVALFTKPMDREFIIKIEDNVVGFINSNERTISLKTMNSYQRFLSYKVADYHNLKHTILRNDENSAIVLYKETLLSQKVKEPLLKDLQQDEYTEILISETLKDVHITDSQEINPAVKESTTTVPKNKKFKILKRKENDTLTEIPEKTDKYEQEDNAKEVSEDTAKCLSQDSVSSLEEQRLQKEKEYEEKKLKIFRDHRYGPESENNSSESSDKTRLESNEKDSGIDQQDDFEEHIWGPVEGSIKNRSQEDIPKYYVSNSNKEKNHPKYANRSNYSQRDLNGIPVGVPPQPMYPTFPVYGEYQTFPVGIPGQQYVQPMVYVQPQNAYGFQGQVPYVNYQMHQGVPQYQRYPVAVNGYGSPYMHQEYVPNRNQPRKKNWNKKNSTQEGNDKK